MSTLNMLFNTQILNRELKLAFENRAKSVTGVIFFLLVGSIFAIAINLPAVQIKTLAPGILWVSLLLANLLSQDGFLRDDFNNGIFEQFYLSSITMLEFVYIKVIVNWLVTSLPLLLIIPILCTMLGLGFVDIKLAIFTLLIGSVALGFLGSVGVALTLGLNKSNILLSIIMLPLYIPIMLLGLSAFNLQVFGSGISGIIALMLAVAITSVLLCPLATVFAIKVNLE